VNNIKKADLDYQPYYCEENVLRLLARPDFRDLATWAVLVSNPQRRVILLRQKAGRPVDGLVHWDYHVFAVAADPVRGKLAFDLDSDLPFPCPLEEYVAETFPAGVQRAFAPRFRVLKGSDYGENLVSDRSHMRRPDGSWMVPPPPWPAPGSGTGRPGNLMDWADMRRRRPGALYSRARMVAFAKGA
jgi:protein N-terminal glutamine amidohydrolase